MKSRWLWIVLAVALVLRLVNAFVLPWQGDERVISDMAAYDRAAVALLHQEPLGVHTAEKYLFHPLGSDTYHPPGYYYFLAAIYAVAGHHYWVVRVVQAVLDTMTCLLVYRLGKDVAGETVGLLSGALVAVYPPFILYTGVLLTETLSMFLLVAAAALVLHFSESNVPWRWRSMLGAGILLGLAALTRSVLLVMVPVILVWALWMGPRWPGYKSALGYGLALVAPVILVIAPITVRNYQLHERFILISTNGGVNFFLGHGGTERVKYQVRNIPEDPVPGQLIGISNRTAPEEEDYFYELGWRYIVASPWRTVRRLPGKLQQMYWASEYWPATDAQVRILRASDWVLWRLGALPWALLGLWHWRDRLFIRRLLLYGLMGATLVIPLAFWAQPRFRVPVVPFFFVLASAAAVTALQGWRPSAISQQRSF